MEHMLGNQAEFGAHQMMLDDDDLLQSMGVPTFQFEFSGEPLALPEGPDDSCSRESFPPSHEASEESSSYLDRTMSEHSYSSSEEKPTKQRRKNAKRSPPAKVKQEVQPVITYDPHTRGTNAFKLSKAELLSLNTDTFKLYCDEVLAHHDLSKEEQTLMKKYRRQLLNRQSAQLSRKRKQERVATLEEEIDVLQKENRRLQSRVTQLENALQAVGASVPEPLLGESPTKSSRSKRSRRSQGVGLFIVLLSFGFVSWGFSGALFATAPSALPVEQFVGRDLLAAQDVIDLPVVKKPVNLVRERPKEVGAPPPRQPAMKKKSAVKIIDAHEAALVPVDPSAASTLVRKHEFSPFDGWQRPNTEYMYCPVAHQVSSQRVTNPDLPPRISLLLPSEAFNGTVFDPAVSFPDRVPPLIEVSCDVMDVYPVWPEGKIGKFDVRVRV